MVVQRVQVSLPADDALAALTITRQAIRRGSFDSVRELTAAIRRFIDGRNDRCQPFVRTKPTEEILAHATRKETS